MVFHSRMGGTDWITTRDATTLLGVSLRTLYRFIDLGELPAYKIGRVIRLKACELNAFHHRALAEGLLPPPSETMFAPTMSAPTDSSMRLHAFLTARNEGRPAPCLICGQLVELADLPAHLLEHR